MRDIVRRKKAQKEPSPGPSRRDVEFEKQAESYGREAMWRSSNKHISKVAHDNIDKNQPAVRWSPGTSLTLLSVVLDPHMSDIVHDMTTVSARMYPMASAIGFNPVSPENWFNVALADKALLHGLLYAYAASIRRLELL
jgi:hypothetical protein